MPSDQPSGTGPKTAEALKALGHTGYYAPVEEPRITQRANILQTAHTIIHGDREKDYGAPIDSFRRLAEAFNLVLRPHLKDGYELQPTDAVALMIAMKLSRLAGGDTKDDTYVDLAGYAALGAEVRDLQ